MRKLVALNLFLLLFITFPIENDGVIPAGGIEPLRSGTNRTYISLGGTELIEDAANIRILGERYSSGVGTFSFVGDINSDGIPDLAIAAPGMTGLSGKDEDGKIYVFYGDGDGFPDLIDLHEADPDLVIRGNCPSSSDPSGNKLGLAMATGMLAEDIDGDGINDLVIVCPSDERNPVLVIIYCPESGWPEWMSITLDDDIYLKYIPLNELLHTDAYVDSSDGPLFSTISKCVGGFQKAMDSQYTPFLQAEDIDGDGYLDIIGSGCYTPTYTKNGIIYYHYYGNVRIIWGGPHDEMELTVIYKENYDRFGFSMDIGDIDGDGYLDMAVGTPLGSTEMLKQCGNVSIYFNITGLRDVRLERYDTSRKTVIHGSGDNDQLGYSVMLRDLNGDGKDDVIASSPNNDGPGDDTRDCGAIFIFNGRPKIGFPSEMYDENSFDLLVLGAEDPVNRQGSGFQLGRQFSITDLTGDGELDLITTVHGQDLPSIGTDPRYMAGVVLFYDHSTAFGSRVVRLGNPSGLFTIEGMDLEDGLGFHLGTGDLNGDGLDDIFIGAPSADGIGNDRGKCGEMFVIYSSHIRLQGLSITGDGHEDGTIFASGGRVRFEIPIKNDRPSIPLTGLKVEIGGMMIDVQDIVSYHFFNDPSGGIGGTTAWFECEFTWDFPQDLTDIAFTVTDAEGCHVTRTYRNAFMVARDLSFGEGGSITINGIDIPARGIWAGLGDEVRISGIPIVYTGYDRMVPAGEASIRIGDDSILYHPSWEFEDVLVTQPEQVYSLDIELRETPINSPMLEKGHAMRFPVDGTKPDQPSVTLTQRADLGKIGAWKLECEGGLGPEYDSDGSGVKEYRMIDSGGSTPMLESGRLHATYYMDMDMREHGLSIDEDGLDKDWGLWGPYPELQILPPKGFSARWHGYIRVDNTGMYKLELRGRGEGMMLLDGDVAIPMDDLTLGPGTTDLYLSSEDLHEVVIYYFHRDQDQSPSIHLWWKDDNGTVEVVPSHVLYGPTNSTMIEIDGPSDTTWAVEAIDWVGISSDRGSATAELDLSPPMIDATGIPSWTNETSPLFRIPVSDDIGLDQFSFRYRVLDEGEAFGTWIDSDVRIDDAVMMEDRMVSFTALISPELGPRFRGRIDMEVLDLAGNKGASGPISIGVDTASPEILLMSPGDGRFESSPPYRVSIRVRDMDSGPDPDSLEFGLGNDDIWTPLPYEYTGDPWIVTQDLTLPEGEVKIRYRVRDLAGNIGTASFELSVTVPPENLPPTPIISIPANGSRFNTGTPIVLSAAGTRDDGIGAHDPVLLTWTSNRSGYLGSGFMVEVTLPKGVHRISLFADDGSHNVSAWIEITISDPIDEEDPPGGSGNEKETLTEAIVALVVIMILVSGLAIMGFLYQRNKKAHETSIMLRHEE
ncbi:MAG: FG-GAP-like repeat-containing protein [Candidatus Thermoplasmatota archaeon]|nr:FG-GAP-like repeat-containing protein [Candidatus Thermoplasmatota archaeon]